MFGLTPTDTHSLWEKRVDVLEIRAPRWIIQSVFAPLVLLIIFLLIAGFSTSAMLQAAIAYVPFFLFSIGLYVWVRRLSIERDSPQLAQRKAASIFGSFDASMLVLISATALMSGFSAISLARLSQEFTVWATTLAPLLYLGEALVTLAYSPKLLQQRARSEKPDWYSTPRWVLGATSTLIGLSLVVGIVLARTADTGIDLVVGSAFFFIGAFAILPIYIRGLLEVIVLLLSGFDFGAAPDFQSRGGSHLLAPEDRQ
ncbi:MAG: hypothetical protein ACC700_18445 [Anaerolineales bacterium]